MASSRRRWPLSARRGGFALLLVIWGLGAIALLVASFAGTGRLRLQTAFNIAGAARARSAADAAVDLAIFSLVDERVGRGGAQVAGARDGAPAFCAFGDAAIVVSIVDESGKVDLNAATEALLQDLFVGLAGVAPTQASAMARAIAALRTSAANDIASPPEADDKPVSQGRAAFQTALELDQVAGVDNAIFHRLLPFITVHSRAAGVDPRVAPPALFVALTAPSAEEIARLIVSPFPNRLNRDDSRFASAYRQPGSHGAFTIHAEAALADGPTSVREVLVELESSTGAPFAIREIRQGAPLYLDDLRRLRDGVNLPPC